MTNTPRRPLPGVSFSPSAHSVRVADCGDPECRSAHILLLAADGTHLAQATISLSMVQRILQIINNKVGPQ